MCGEPPTSSIAKEEVGRGRRKLRRLTHRYFAGEILAAHLSVTGKTDEALDILEDIADFAEKGLALSEGTVLTFRCAALDRPEAKVERKRDDNGELKVSAYFRMGDEDCLHCSVGFCFQGRRLFDFLTRLDLSYFAELDQFASIRETERYKVLVERARKLAEL